MASEISEHIQVTMLMLFQVPCLRTYRRSSSTARRCDTWHSTSSCLATVTSSSTSCACVCVQTGPPRVRHSLPHARSAMMRCRRRRPCRRRWPHRHRLALLRHRTNWRTRTNTSRAAAMSPVLLSLSPVTRQGSWMSTMKHGPQIARLMQQRRLPTVTCRLMPWRQRQTLAVAFVRPVPAVLWLSRLVHLSRRRQQHHHATHPALLPGYKVGDHRWYISTFIENSGFLQLFIWCRCCSYSTMHWN